MSHEQHLEVVTKKTQSMLIDYPIETKVIVKDNSHKLYEVGVMAGVKVFGNNIFPIVNIDGKDFVIMGIMRKFDERRNKALDKLNGTEQWNVLAENYIIDE